MKRKSMWSTAGTCIFTVLGLIYITPILIVLMNSFKKKIYINKQPFILPSEKTWNGLENYVTAIDKYGLLESVGWTVFITVGSVLLILLCTSMCAWYITRVQTGFTRMLYLLCVFSMVVPFQMVMFTLSLVADRTGLNTPWGIMIIYLGFGAGLAVFMFCGFVKSIPLEIEEAALIDGCTPIQTFFSVVLPIMKPTYISVGILGKLRTRGYGRDYGGADPGSNSRHYLLSLLSEAHHKGCGGRRSEGIRTWKLKIVKRTPKKGRDFEGLDSNF